MPPEFHSPHHWPHPGARWIWSAEYSGSETNARFRFEKDFDLPKVDGEWFIDIAADSRYRLRLNGTWLADGPARGYPDALFFDRIPISQYLHAGKNTLSVEVTHFGVDTFQYIRGAAGLLLAVFAEDQQAAIVTDLSWTACRLASYQVNVPRISCQLGFEEQVDLTKEFPLQHPVVLSKRQNEKSLPELRNVGLLSQDERPFQRLVSSSQVRSIPQQWTIHLREHLGTFPGGVNTHGLVGLVGAELHASQDDELEISLLGQIRGLYLDGQAIEGAMDQDLRRYSLALKAGIHWLAVAVCDRMDHIFELAIGVRGGFHTKWQSPLGEAASPWISTGPLWRALKSTHCPLSVDGTLDQAVDTFSKDEPRMQELVTRLSACRTAADLFQASPTKVLPISSAYLAEADVYFTIRTDEVFSTSRGDGSPFDGTLALTAGQRVILDTADIVNGYLQFDLESEGVSTLDGYFFEHLKENDGLTIQYLQMDGNSYRSSFRLESPKGRRSFLSAQRRGFRYCLLTLREGSNSVRITNLATIESLYQPKQRATFHCSDERLNDIFRMSQRTLALCMEDTFTDCPSYEQTFWVGDARNEALFAAVTFGSYDLNERCLRLVADSLKTLPMAASQCPSGWDVIIPSFSFLWVLSVWEFYEQTGRKELLEAVYPAVKINLETALRYCTDQGLFSAPTWNFMEWAPMDIGHSTVTHNSIFLAGALEVGAETASVLGDIEQGRRYDEARAKLIPAIQHLWRPEARAYADSIHRNGNVSVKVSQHNSILALLFDLISDPGQRAAAVKACVAPAPDMTTVASPFAMFFLLEALRKEGHPAMVLEKMRSFWSHMLDAQSPTCWEMVYPPTAPFPTRSYCHGWSAAPVYLLPFLFFGIEILEPGWKTIRLRPQNLGLDFVEASVCTPQGPLILRQRVSPEGRLTWDFQAPPGIEVLVDESEPSHR